MLVCNFKFASASVELGSSDSKISFTRYIGFWSEDDHLPYFTFKLTNMGNETATGIHLIPSSLIASEASTFSLAPSYIGSDNVNAYTVDTELTPGESMNATYALKQEFLRQVGWNESRYTGQLQVIGDNFDPITLEVEFSFRDNPWSYFVFAWIGIGLAIGFGLLYFRWEKGSKLEKELDDDVSIIEHINVHIASINNYKDTILPEAWRRIGKAFKARLKLVIKAREDLALVKDDEAVVWFEKLDNYIRENRMFDNALPVSPNRTLPKVAQLTKKIREYKKKKKMEKELKATWKDRKKWAYILVASFIAAISTVVAQASFAGNPLLNAFVAVSIGFLIYRAQDIFNAIKE
jgi:hypothetical protein